MIYRSPVTQTEWFYRRVEITGPGRTFVDSLPAILQHADQVLPSGARALHTLHAGKTFTMHKSETFVIPPNLFVGGDDVYVGLGWDCEASVDLDASIVPLDKKGRCGTPVYFGDKTAIPGIVHQGDNTTGAGDGDDERILVDLDEIPKKFEELVVTVNVYSSTKSFKNVSNAYVRLVSVATGETLLRYNLEAGTCTESGVVFAKLFRTVGSWAIQGIGANCGGRSVSNTETKKAVESWHGVKFPDFDASLMVHPTSAQDPGVHTKTREGASLKEIPASSHNIPFLIQISASGLPNKDGWFSASDPFVVFTAKRPGSDQALEYWRSHTVFNNLSPIWKVQEINVPSGFMNHPLLITAYDYDEGKPPDYLGEVLVQGGFSELSERANADFIHSDKEPLTRAYDTFSEQKRRSMPLTLQLAKGPTRKHPGKKRGTLNIGISQLTA